MDFLYYFFVKTTNKWINIICITNFITIIKLNIHVIEDQKLKNKNKNKKENIIYWLKKTIKVVNMSSNRNYIECYTIRYYSVIYISIIWNII